MPKKSKELSALSVSKIKKTGRHTVGGVDGLCLNVEGNSRVWILRAVVGKRLDKDGKLKPHRRDIGIGPYPEISLAEARAKATELRLQIRSGIDPIAHKQEQLEKLSKQVEDGSDAQTTIKTLQEKLAAQSKLAKMATIETKLNPLVIDSIAPVGDLLGFMDLEKIVVSEDGSVSGLTEQLASVRESRSYLFKQTEEGGESNPGQRNTGAGTGNPGNPGNVGAGGKSPKEVGQFGKQIAQAVSSKKNTDEAPQFFR